MVNSASGAGFRPLPGELDMTAKARPQGPAVPDRKPVNSLRRFLGLLPPAAGSASPEATQAAVAAAAVKAQAPLSAADQHLAKVLEGREPHQRAQHKILEAAIKQAEARKAGVDLAKSNYFIKLMTFAGVAVTFGVTLALTVATAGAAAPMMALTSLRLITAIGDVHYARKCVAAAQESLRTGMPAKAPPMGGSCVGNWLHAYRVWRNDSPEAARDYATSRGAAFTICLSLAMVVTGTLWTPAAAMAGTVSKWVSSCIMGLMVPYELKVGFGDTRGQARAAMEATLMFEDACDIACGRVGVRGYAPGGPQALPEGEENPRLTAADRLEMAEFFETVLGPYRDKPPIALAELTGLRAQMAATDRPNDPAASADAAKRPPVVAGLRAKAREKAGQVDVAWVRWTEAQAGLQQAQVALRNARSTLRSVRAQVPLPDARATAQAELQAAQTDLLRAQALANERRLALEKAQADAEQAREAWRSTTRLYIAANTTLGFVKSAAAACAKLA